MKSILLLAWRYVAFNKLKTCILVACLSTTLFLPLAVRLLIAKYNGELTGRAADTPLILAAKGSRFDSVLKTLYFRKTELDMFPSGEVEKVYDNNLALALPLHLKFTASGFPIVGTCLEYYDFRNLRLAKGRHHGILGEAVIGSKVAEQLKLGPGDTLLSDQENLYDISKSYPLKMHITGVFEPTDSSDDSAVFVDHRTTWLIEGLYHGHENVTTKGANLKYILQTTEDNVTANAALAEYNEVTREKLKNLHAHGTRTDFPLSSIIVVPKDEKSKTMLKARYDLSEVLQILSPLIVVEEMMSIVFRVKEFFDASSIVVGICTCMFLILVVLLSLRIRSNERDTMHKLGCRRSIVFWLQATELLIIFGISVVFVALVAGVSMAMLPGLTQMMK